MLGSSDLNILDQTTFESELHVLISLRLGLFPSPTSMCRGYEVYLSISIYKVRLEVILLLISGSEKATMFLWLVGCFHR